MEPLVASTTEHLGRSISDRRNRLGRLFRSLHEVTGILATHYDPSQSLDEQTTEFAERGSDVGAEFLEAMSLIAELSALEEIPRVG